MDRRTFLSATSAAWLFPACQITDMPLKPLSKLAATFEGQLISPSHPQYALYNHSHNSRYDSIQPALIARCATEADIRYALGFVLEQQLPFRIRGGGHHYAGQSQSNGVIIDLAQLNKAAVHNQNAVIAAGATLGHVYAELAKKGHTLAAGSCASVGVTGLTLGGGLGIAARRYGLTCDSLQSARIIIADGSVLNCSSVEHADLFGALKGGGGGQFGIVTQLQFSTFRPDTVYNGRASFSSEQGAQLLAYWQQWARSLPSTLWSQLAIWCSGKPDMPCSFTVRLISIDSQQVAYHYWQHFLQHCPETATRQSFNAEPYLEFMLADCKGLDQPQCQQSYQHPQGKLQRVAQAASSDFFCALPLAACVQLENAMQARNASGQSAGVLLTVMGGAIADVTSSASTFAHRRAMFCAQYLVQRPAGTDTAELAEAQQWANSMRKKMARFSTGGAYVNYADPLIENWPQAYYGDYLDDLLQIKKQYDPGNVFQSRQGLGTLI